MITILRIAIVVFVVWFFYLLVKDSRENGSKDVPMKTKVLYGIMGCILNLLDTLGVGSNATQAAFFKFTKLSPDEELPGNGNVIFAIPVGVEALLFLKIVEVEPVTLFSMLIAAMLGGIVGSKVITKLPVQKIRMILSVTLPCVAVLLVMKVNGFGPFGMLGTATGLSGDVYKRQVPCEMSRRNYEACASEKMIFTVPEAGHTLSYMVDYEGYRETVSAFMKKIGCETDRETERSE